MRHACHVRWLVKPNSDRDSHSMFARVRLLRRSNPGASPQRLYDQLTAIEAQGNVPFFIDQFHYVLPLPCIQQRARTCPHLPSRNKKKQLVLVVVNEKNNRENTTRKKKKSVLICCDDWRVADILAQPFSICFLFDSFDVSANSTRHTYTTVHGRASERFLRVLISEARVRGTRENTVRTHGRIVL